MDVIPSLQWNLNNTHVAAIDASPHEFLFGFRIPTPIDHLTQVKTQDVRSLRFIREHLRRDAQLAMDITTSLKKRRYDLKPGQIKYSDSTDSSEERQS